MKQGQKVTWELGSFGFREAIRKGDESAHDALRDHVCQMFTDVNVFDGDGEVGEFSFSEDSLEYLQEQVADAVCDAIADPDATTADRQAKKDQDAEETLAAAADSNS